MTIPNAEAAIIAEDKICDYLLNRSHRRGGSKAKFLVAMGYSPGDWRRLADDLRAQHLTVDAANESASDYGKRYEIIAPLVGPNGRSAEIVTVWQIDIGTDAPRLITLYPE